MQLVRLESLLRRFRPERAAAPAIAKPKRVFWWWEQICNLGCNHCDIGKRTRSYRIEPALDLAEKRAVIDTLRRWIDGPFSLSLIAGEPFLHPNVFEVLAAAESAGATTSLTTNGTLLATQKQAARVIESGLSFMAVSLDSHEPTFHDETRGRPGAWARARKALEHLLEARAAAGVARPTIYVNSIAMRGNLDSVLRLGEWVAEVGLDGHTIQPIASTTFFQGLDDAGPRWFENSPLWPDTDDALRFVDELERRKEAGAPIQSSAEDFRKWRSYFRDPVAFGKLESCESELDSMLVTHDGRVKMCPNTRESFGSILRDDLDTMWSSGAAQRAREHVYECDSQCKILANNKDDFFF